MKFFSWPISLGQWSRRVSWTNYSQNRMMIWRGAGTKRQRGPKLLLSIMLIEKIVITDTNLSRKLPGWASAQHHSESAKSVIPMKYCDVIPAGLIATLRRRLITKLFLRPMTGPEYHGGCPKKKRGSPYRITPSYCRSLGVRLLLNCIG